MCVGVCEQTGLTVETALITEEDLEERPIGKGPISLPRGTNTDDRSPWNPGMRIFDSTPAAGVEAAMDSDGGLESSPETAADGGSEPNQRADKRCRACWDSPTNPAEARVPHESGSINCGSSFIYFSLLPILLKILYLIFNYL